MSSREEQERSGCNIKPKLKGCSYRSIYFKLSSNEPAQQYITTKLINNTVRVESSLYADNLASLNVYQSPFIKEQNVNWNQYSDRAQPHEQPSIVSGGSFYHASSTRGTITRCRPNAGCPGGMGVDIKHGSYARRLLRLKGKGPSKLGVIPRNYGANVPFIPSQPVYGGKTMKPSIAQSNRCKCPEIESIKPLYKLTTNPIIMDTSACALNIGDIVYVLTPDNFYEKALISGINSIDNFNVLIQTGKYKGKTFKNDCSELLLYYKSTVCDKDLDDEPVDLTTLNNKILNTCNTLADFNKLNSITSYIPDFYISPLYPYTYNTGY
jgi:hypothetical protein